MGGVEETIQRMHMPILIDMTVLRPGLHLLIAWIVTPTSMDLC